MGLGKTLTMISLVLATVNDDKSSDSSSDDSSNNEYYESKVKNCLKQGLLSVLMFHGNNISVDDTILT